MGRKTRPNVLFSLVCTNKTFMLFLTNFQNGLESFFAYVHR